MWSFGGTGNSLLPFRPEPALSEAEGNLLLARAAPLLAPDEFLRSRQDFFHQLRRRSLRVQAQQRFRS